MHKLRVAVLRGGPSSEYDVSLKTGQTILKNLPNTFDVKDVLIDKEGVWHLHGVPRQPHEILKHVDAVVIGMHGAYGEDGTVQKLLETFKVPYTGSDALGSALGMNKNLSKKVFKTHGIKTPYHELASIPGSIEHQALKIFRSFPLPMVIKPVSAGSSVGVTIARTLPEIEAGLRKAYEHGDQVMIEEYIPGREATCGVVEGLRGEAYYALPPVEIKPGDHFFSYESKYTPGGSVEICPGNFSVAEKKAIQEMAIAAHKFLNLRHYSRADFIVHPRRGVYMLEVNTLPGLTQESLLPKSLAAIGVSLSEFLGHLVNLALGKK